MISTTYYLQYEAVAAGSVSQVTVVVVSVVAGLLLLLAIIICLVRSVGSRRGDNGEQSGNY